LRINECRAVDGICHKVLTEALRRRIGDNGMKIRHEYALTSIQTKVLLVLLIHASQYCVNVHDSIRSIRRFDPK